jgi:hypothetical protein
MPDSSDYARLWNELKSWVEYEAEAMRDDARRAGRARRAEDAEEYDRLSGEADAMSRVLQRMEQLEK